MQPLPGGARAKRYLVSRERDTLEPALSKVLDAREYLGEFIPKPAPSIGYV